MSTMHSYKTVSIFVYGKVMSRDVPICNILAICREVLNYENCMGSASSREVFYIMGCH